MQSRWKLLLSAPQNPRFWLSTALNFVSDRFAPTTGVVGKKPDANYDFQRDRHPVREKHNRHTGWEEEVGEDGVVRRKYATYEEYVLHQQQKLDEMVKIKGGFSRRDILFFRLRFYSRFRQLRGMVPADGVILCAGAREGTEVAVLRELGFSNAYGIDLNPGAENKLVRKGDFMHLENPDGSVDFFYTNCVDHAFDLDAFFAEHARVLKPDGLIMYEFCLSGGNKGAFETVAWSREEDIVCKALKHFKELVRADRDSEWLWVLMRGKRTQGEK